MAGIRKKKVNADNLFKNTSDYFARQQMDMPTSSSPVVIINIIGKIIIPPSESDLFKKKNSNIRNVEKIIEKVIKDLKDLSIKDLLVIILIIILMMLKYFGICNLHQLSFCLNYRIPLFLFFFLRS